MRCEGFSECLSKVGSSREDDVRQSFFVPSPMMIAFMPTPDVGMSIDKHFSLCAQSADDSI